MAKFKQIGIPALCAECRENEEYGDCGVARSVLNMRQRGDALEAVGNPDELFQLSPGHNLLVVDDRGGVRRFITSYGREISLYAFETEGASVQICNIPVATLDSEPLEAVSVGDFVVVRTAIGLRYLHYKGENSYDMVNIEDAMPDFVFVDVEKYAASHQLHSFTFNNAYPQWKRPLADADLIVLRKRFADAYEAIVVEEHSKGRFTQPVAVRIAIRLVDGNFLWAGAPLIVGCGVQGGDFTDLPVVSGSGGLVSVEAGNLTINTYALGVSVLKAPSRSFDSLIKSVELYVCEPEEVVACDMINYRCAVVEKPSRKHYLSAALPVRSAESVGNELANVQKWKLLASITDIDALRSGVISGTGWSGCSDLSAGIGGATWVVKRPQDFGGRVDESIFAKLGGVAGYSYIPDKVSSFDGILYMAGGKRTARCLWGAEEMMQGALKDSDVQVATEIVCRDGESASVLRSVTSVRRGVAVLSPMLSTTLPGAFRMAVSMLVSGVHYRVEVPLTPARSGEYSYYVNPELKQVKLAVSQDAFPSAQTPAVSLLTPNLLLATVPCVPLVADRSVMVGDGTVTDVVPAIRQVSANIFGKFPLYVFTTRGVYAVNVDSPNLRPRCIAPVPVAAGNAVTRGFKDVYFVSSGKLYAIVGGAVSTFGDACGAVSIEFVHHTGELWGITADGAVTVWNASGRFYGRTLRVKSFHGFLATTRAGSVVNLAVEKPASSITVDYNSYVFATAKAPRVIEWHLHGKCNAAVLRLNGYEHLECGDKLLFEEAVKGDCRSPLKRRLLAPGFFRLSLSFSGNVASGFMLHPTTLTV